MKHISNGTGSNELFEDPMNHHQICSILFHPFHHQIHEQILWIIQIIQLNKFHGRATQLTLTWMSMSRSLRRNTVNHEGHMFVSCYSLMLQLPEGFSKFGNIRQSKWLNLVAGTWWLFQWDDSNSSNEKCLFHQTSIKKTVVLGFQVGNFIGFDGSLIYGSKSEVGIGIPTGVGGKPPGNPTKKWGARFKRTKARQWYCWWRKCQTTIWDV